MRFVNSAYRINFDDHREVNLNGVELVANMHTLRCGWVRWECGFPVKEIIGKVSEGFQPPRRAELGDCDESLWQASEDGIPLDPWRQTFDLIVWDEGANRDYQYDTYHLVFEISQREDMPGDGTESLGILCRVYAANGEPNNFPMIELATDDYSFTAGPAPRINVVGWNSVRDSELAAIRAQVAPPKVVKLPAKRRRA